MITPELVAYLRGQAEAPDSDGEQVDKVQIRLPDFLGLLDDVSVLLGTLAYIRDHALSNGREVAINALAGIAPSNDGRPQG